MRCEGHAFDSIHHTGSQVITPGARYAAPPPRGAVSRWSLLQW
jgi:hypothetical protein